MKVLAADDKPLVLKDIKRTLEKALPEGGEVITAEDPAEVMDIIQDEDIRIAFLDIEMPGIDGLELARLIYKTSPRTNVFFVTGFEKYALEAWELSELNVCGFIKKPISVERIRSAMNNLKFPLHDLSIKCFGNFEVFYRGEPLALGGDIARKILAYLVHLNGSSCTMGELAAAVWENKIDEGTLGNQLRTHISRLKKALSAVDMENLIVKNEHNRISIDRTAFDCDYYDYLAGKESARLLPVQGYMKEYSWGTEYIDRM